MNRVEQHSLFSERAALERMIADTPAEDVIDLRSLQVRLEIINRALAKHPVETRFGQDNLHEEPQPFSGVFQGALPKRRTFEFRLAGTAEVVTGKIRPGITDPSAINRHLDQHQEPLQHADEPVDVGFIERGVQLVQHTEGTGLDLVNREQQRHGDQYQKRYQQTDDKAAKSLHGALWVI